MKELQLRPEFIISLQLHCRVSAIEENEFLARGMRVNIILHVHRALEVWLGSVQKGCGAAATFPVARMFIEHGH